MNHLKKIIGILLALCCIQCNCGRLRNQDDKKHRKGPIKVSERLKQPPIDPPGGAGSNIPSESLNTSAKEPPIDDSIAVLKQSENQQISNDLARQALHSKALEQAMALDQPEIVQMLLEKKVLIDQQTGNTPLHTAVLHGAANTVQALLHQGADLEACNHMGDSPLLMAIKAKDTSMINLLLKHQADTNKIKQESTNQDQLNQILQEAIQEKNEDLIDALLKCGANPNLALHLVAQLGTPSMLSVVLAHRPDINYQNQNGHTALYLATLNRNVEMAQLLIENKADVSIGANDGESPLFISVIQSASSRNFRMVELLLKNGANQGGALFNGLINPTKENIQLFLQYKADVNFKLEDGETLLHRAIGICEPDEIQLLLDNGADVQAADDRGHTALHDAAQFGSLAKVKLLLTYGANPFATNKEGKTPQNLAEERLRAGLKPCWKCIEADLQATIDLFNQLHHKAS